MPVAPSSMMVALGYGLVVGWGLGLRGEDRRLMLTVEALAAAVGVLIWLTGPSPGSEPATAAVSLAVGGVAAVVSTLLLGRRTASA